MYHVNVPPKSIVINDENFNEIQKYLRNNRWIHVEGYK